jgi:hypothetical protein
LYHRPTDPGEVHDVWREHPSEAKRLHGEYLRFLRENDCPAENWWPRRWFFSWGKPAVWQETLRPEAQV